MKFAELYKDNVLAVKKALKSLWCCGTIAESQKAYTKQIEKLIDEELFASESFVPLVQCMERYPSITIEQYKALDEKIQKLWEKSIGKTIDNEKFFTPYVHQSLAWNALKKVKSDSEIKQSMVVTTGTGSGKTECFMLPLVNDLTDNDGKAKNIGCVEALFLYPLNALMEDQKERLHKLLDGTGLKFASYNSNLPKEYIEKNDLSKYDKETNSQIEAEKKKYPNTIVATRKELHQTPPNILLTNPSMLEYMLMRKNDQHLFEGKSLKWIVIDEAHTYSGAAATELAMLIRRVLNAFGIEDPNTIRFALSSATIGNEENKDNKQAQLLDFISGITGVDNITPIEADRTAKKKSENKQLEICRDKLIREDYVSLKELIPQGESIYEKLQILDEMCDDSMPLRAKVHFFYRVPNNGLSVMLNELNDEQNAFKVYSSNIIDGEAPMLELVQCRHCGEFFAIGEDGSFSDMRDTSGRYKYQAVVGNENDMFDFDTNVKKKLLLFSYVSPTNILHKNNQQCCIDNDSPDVFIEDTNGNIVYNSKAECPHCGVSLLAKNKDAKNNEDENTTEEIKNKAVNRFRISSDYLARTLAPNILPHLHEYDTNLNKGFAPHKGQQYISFVDSRQAAARSTLNQNIEQERLWIYSRALKALEENIPDVDSLKRDIEKIDKEIDEAFAIRDIRRITELSNKKELKSKKLSEQPFLTWERLYEKLAKTTFPDVQELELDFLCNQFIDKDNSKEVEKIDLTKAKYLHLIMKEQLGRHKKVDVCPESMGLFTSYYPILERITALPVEVEEFNCNYGVNIDINQWKNLLKIYIDYKVRADESFYLKIDGCNTIDIFNIERYATSKAPRRQVNKPKVKDGGIQLNVVYLLAKLISPTAGNLNDVAKSNKEAINNLLNALWRDLTTENINLLSQAWQLNGDVWSQERNRQNTDEALVRLNLKDIAFKLYDKEMHLCYIDDNNVRPVDTLFMGYSPYLVNGNVVKPKISVIRNEDQTNEDWNKCKKQLLDDNGVWGENGCFASLLDKVCSRPDIFIQAEHTAQIESKYARANQYDFKNRKINILACSTTMEMGVDLGNMELVMMQSIPPHPTNYKQRAGRSGRNDDNRSVAMTLCDSSAIGLRTLHNPLKALINRRMSVPTVDVMNEMVVRRHINAFLMRKFMKEVGNATELDKDKVVHFFTHFDIKDHIGDRGQRNGKYIVFDNQTLYPDDGLGNKEQTLYSRFLNWLGNVELNPDNNDDYQDIKNELRALVKNTCCEKEFDYFVECKKDIKGCYEELVEKVSYYAKVYKELRKKYPNDVRDRAVITGKGWSIYRKYTEILGEKLDKFFSTNRFTPNATMPINVISFSKSPKEEWGHKYKIVKNPTYSLREAIAQYAPGNTVVIQNRTLVVAGVEYTGIDLGKDSTRSFDKLLSDGNITVLEHDKDLLKSEAKIWTVNDSTELILVKPVMYRPDITADPTRTIEKNPYTQVSAQLIDVNKWDRNINPNRMIDARSNDDVGNGRILYYNQGIGHGYAFCRNCGKAVIEVAAGAKELPIGITVPHNNIRELHSNKREKECNNPKMISRHVVFGDYIQTDFCEIRIKERPGTNWINERHENKKLLTTIGLLIATSFCEYKGKDRNDIDFVLMPNGHLCVFDTNPGGAGYSNKLANSNEMFAILESCKERIDSIKSKDELLDKYSTRYIHDIDIDVAKKWLEDALASFERVPDNVAKAFQNAKVVYRSEFGNELKNTKDAILIVNNEFERWNWDEWRRNLEHLGASNHQVVVDYFKSKYAPAPIKEIKDNIKGYTGKDVKRFTKAICERGFWPLAIVGDKLFFTDEKENSMLNRSWAKDGSLYCIAGYETCETENLIFNDSACFKFTVAGQNNVTTQNLTDVVLNSESRSENLINDFKKDIRNCKTIEVEYSDEYIRTPLAMVVVLQFIDKIISQLGFDGNINIKIRGERYWDRYKNDMDYENHLKKYYLRSDDRDYYFKKLIEKWNRKATISTVYFGVLPHWRELKIVGNTKQLTIYPNGGIMNGWELANDSDDKDFDRINPNTDNYSLRQKDPKIMYDIELTDING